MELSKIWEKWNDVKMPPIYKRQGQECYLDPIRQKLIYITPEEKVRQRVIAYLTEELNVPQSVIACEKHLSHYGVETKKRADIIIHEYDEDDKIFYPVAVIECKSPDVFIVDKEINQVVGYADILECDYIVIVNGVDIHCWHYDATNNEYVPIKNLPKYDGLIKGKYKKIPEIGPPPSRAPYDELKYCLEDYIRNWEIGEDTTPEKAIPMVNFCECYYDTNHKMPSKEYNIFRIIEDLGIRNVTYGNSSGGSYSGSYRSFLIEYKNNTEIVSIALSAYSTYAKQDVSKTCINIAIDNEKVSHHALQYGIDDNMVVGKEEYKFYHHGRIAVGRIGSGKVGELREFVLSEVPELVEQGRFNLGSLPKNRLWYLDDPIVANFIANLIAYSLIRDEYRKYVKQRAKYHK